MKLTEPDSLALGKCFRCRGVHPANTTAAVRIAVKDRDEEIAVLKDDLEAAQSGVAELHAEHRALIAGKMEHVKEIVDLREEVARLKTEGDNAINRNVELMMERAKDSERIQELEAENDRLMNVASDCATKLNEIRYYVMSYPQDEAARNLVERLERILNQR